MYSYFVPFFRWKIDENLSKVFDNTRNIDGGYEIIIPKTRKPSILSTTKLNNLFTLYPCHIKVGVCNAF